MLSPASTFGISTALAFMLACSPALSKDAPSKQQQLVGGISYIVPDYQAGAKFRTPEAIDTALAENLAKHLSTPLKIVRAQQAQGGELLEKHKADFILASGLNRSRASLTTIPTGYSAGPMAIMRTDTTIKQPGHLRGRTVCVSEGGSYVGMLASRYGAIEQVYKAPADSLLALRIGTCDAAVHDSAMLSELLKLPEWKKFSASIGLGPSVPLEFVVRSDDLKLAASAKTLTEQWKKNDFLQKETSKRVRHIAFEVYLDQNVPDCH
jgi:polar amino acid transport system substrate-binding protein